MISSMTIVAAINEIDANLVSFLVLGIIFARSLSGRDEAKTKQARLFQVLSAIVLTVLALDSLLTLGDGSSRAWLRPFLLAGYGVYYVMQSTIGFIWLWYVRVIVRPRRSLRSAFLIFALPALVCAALSALSPLTGWCFWYDGAMRYHRGNFSYLIMANSLLYVVLSYVSIVVDRAKLSPKKYHALLSFAAAPTLGGLIQIFNQGVCLLWPGLVISLFLIYLNLQNEQLNLDHLTGVNNRRGFDLELSRRVAEAREDSPFGLILIDLDGFKKINDAFGHAEGDLALKAMAGILRKCFHNEDFIARFGGDEFVAIVSIKEENDLKAIQKRLLRMVSDWNESSRLPWRLALSMGYALYPVERQLSADAFFKEVDKLLYADKEGKNANRTVKA
jgi:diguanylate cyclase (GGDEF)-like protein